SIKSKFIKTETIFDFLSKHKIKGTFFGVFDLIDIGEEKEDQIKIFKAIINEGHELGLHGYNHLPLTEDALNKSMKLARELLGVTLSTYSSPWGDDRDATVQLLEKNKFKGFRVWTMDERRDTDLVQLRYRNNLEGCKFNEKYIILNIHGPDMYPVGKKKIELMIEQLKLNGYEFIRFKDIVKEFKNDN
ncbi:DUF2194 domain-containing protein, partial [Vibrio ponticus]